MMKKYIFSSLVIALIGLVSCQKPKKKLTVSRYDPASSQFAFLKEPLQDVKILALGESSHGFGSMHALKANLVKYLHEEMDFDVLILEAGYADVGIVWANIEESEPKQIINATVSGNLRSEQLLPLFAYLKDQSQTEDPLQLRGMDSRISGHAFRFRMNHLLRRLESRKVKDSILIGLKAFNKTFDVLNDREEWQKHKDEYLSTITWTKSIIEDNREDIKELEIVKDEEIDIFLKNLTLMEAAVDYQFGETYTKGLALRDSLMAENVFEFVEKEFPDRKFIIWAHNGHIEKAPGEGDNIKWLGHYLKERYGDKYYALGMYAKKGMIYQSKERKTSNFDISDKSFIEGKLDADYGKDVFLDLPAYDAENTAWIHKSIFGYELEAGGKVKFVPSQRFDGVLLLGETEAPRYLINTENPRR